MARRHHLTGRSSSKGSVADLSDLSREDPGPFMARAMRGGRYPGLRQADHGTDRCSFARPFPGTLPSGIRTSVVPLTVAGRLRILAGFPLPIQTQDVVFAYRSQHSI